MFVSQDSAPIRTCLMPCFLAVIAIRIAVHGLSCRVARVEGSLHEKFDVIALNIWERQVKISSHMPKSS
jgi:hypothetical protein